MQEEARQKLAVMRYLEQLSDTQVAFSVTQKRPKTLAEAVALTLETESLAIGSGVSSCKERLRSLVAGTQTENSTTDINAQGLLTTLLQRMGKLEDRLAEARIHMPSSSPIVGCGKRRNYREGHAHSQMSTTQINFATTPVLPINSSSAYKIPAFVNNICVNFLLDTGAAVSLIRKDVWEQVNAKKQQQLSPTGHRLVGVDGTPLKILGAAQVGIRIGRELFFADLIILECLTTDAIFGLDFLQAN